jgi:hypothetical protein
MLVVFDYFSMLFTHARHTAACAVGACCVSHVTIANAPCELLCQQQIMTGLCTTTALLQCVKPLQRL